jgi:hypothetical protein
MNEYSGESCVLIEHIGGMYVGPLGIMVIHWESSIKKDT